MIEKKWAQQPDPAVSDAFAIRQAVFVQEQGFQSEFDEVDDRSWHLICYENHQPIACARIYTDDGRVWHAGRIAVVKSARKTGMGAVLMAAVADKIQELGGEKIVVGAQCQAAGFYEKQGFQRTEREYLDENCPHVEMFRVLK